jgi:hypothetical protein
VKVIAVMVDQSTDTGREWARSRGELPAVMLDLYITTVSYGLVKKAITLRAENPEFTIVSMKMLRFDGERYRDHRPFEIRKRMLPPSKH